MKLVSRVLAVLAAVAIATPAFACGDKANMKNAEAKPASSQTVAKSGEKKSTPHAKRATEAKPATAAN